MNQEKIGQFIADTRKQSGLTQKELAKRMGISDKTISKWECGNGIPDITYLESLCEALNINVNELLSGNRLSDTDYSAKAEENIMNLMKENKLNLKNNKLQIIVGIIMIFVTLITPILIYNDVFLSIANFFDFISLLILSVLSIAEVLLSGKNTKYEIIDFVHKTIIPNGLIISLVQGVVVLARLDLPRSIGPHLAASLLALLYAVIVYLVTLLMKERLDREA